MFVKLVIILGICSLFLTYIAIPQSFSQQNKTIDVVNNFTAIGQLPDDVQIAIIFTNGTEIRGWMIEPRFEWNDPASMAGCAVGGALGWISGGGSITDKELWKEIATECAG